MSDIVNLILLIIALIVIIKTCKNVERVIENVYTQVFHTQKELTQLKARHAEMSLELASMKLQVDEISLCNGQNGEEVKFVYEEETE